MQQALFSSARRHAGSAGLPAEVVPANAARTSPVRSAEDDARAQAGLERAIDRLEEAVEQETAALRNRAHVDLKDFSTRKSHGLLELTRAMRLFDGGAPSEPMRARLAGLRAKLETNRAVIGMHLEAVREISTMVADAMRDAESDGTYSASIGQGGRRS